jgi:hypothetical protein
MRRAFEKALGAGGWGKAEALECKHGERRDHRKKHTHTQTDMGECAEWVCEGRQTEEAEGDRWGRQVRERGRGTGRERQTK